MKVKTQLLPVLLALATSCATHNEKIAFSDDADVRAAVASASAPQVLPHLERANELRIEQVIFGYLLERHFWDLADYSAVFLQADDTRWRP